MSSSFLMKLFASLWCLSFSISAGAVSAPKEITYEQVGQENKTESVRSEVSTSLALDDLLTKKQYKKIGFLPKFKQTLANGFRSLSVPKPKRVYERGKPQAIAGFVLGLLGILTFIFPFSIVAIVLGSVSMKRYREGFHDQKGLAKAAIILGIIGLCLVLLFLGLSFASFFLI